MCFQYWQSFFCNCTSFFQYILLSYLPLSFLYSAIALYRPFYICRLLYIDVLRFRLYRVVLGFRWNYSCFCIRYIASYRSSFWLVDELQVPLFVFGSWMIDIEWPNRPINLLSSLCMPSIAFHPNSFICLALSSIYIGNEGSQSYNFIIVMIICLPSYIKQNICPVISLLLVIDS